MVPIKIVHMLNIYLITFSNFNHIVTHVVEVNSILNYISRNGYIILSINSRTLYLINVLENNYYHDTILCYPI